jgi:ribonuclease Z
MRYVVLGSSASLPTETRNPLAGLLICNSERVLIDCGEGTSRQLQIYGQSLQKISFVWISHSHIEHYSGIACFFRYLDMISKNASVPVFSDERTIAGIHELVKLCHLRSLNVETHVVHEGLFHQTETHLWTAFPVRHTVPATALCVEEKPKRRFRTDVADNLGIPPGPMRAQLASGKTVSLADGRKVSPDDILDQPRAGRRFVYITDSMFFDDLVDFCRGADLLVCESTYLSNDAKLAEQYRHLTALDAAKLAKEAAVGQLVLTHISPRINTPDILHEVRQIFENVNVAEDLAEFDMCARE